VEPKRRFARGHSQDKGRLRTGRLVDRRSPQVCLEHDRPAAISTAMCPAPNEGVGWLGERDDSGRVIRQRRLAIEQKELQPVRGVLAINRRDHDLATLGSLHRPSQRVSLMVCRLSHASSEPHEQGLSSVGTCRTSDRRDLSRRHTNQRRCAKHRANRHGVPAPAAFRRDSILVEVSRSS